jgi:hypothetical protein
MELDDNKVIEYLRTKSKEQDLANKALLGAKERVINHTTKNGKVTKSGFEINIENIEFKFRKTSICFNNSLSSYHFETEIDIENISDGDSQEIGFYILNSSMNGEKIDDSLTFYHYYA